MAEVLKFKYQTNSVTITLDNSFSVKQKNDLVDSDHITEIDLGLLFFVVLSALSL